MRREDELIAFQKEINLTEYAASKGYALDRKESSRNSVVMRNGGDKVVIAIGSSSYWIYFSVHDDSDNGTIINFVQNRYQSNLGEVRKELRPWLSGRSVDHSRQKSLFDISHFERPKADQFVQTLAPLNKDSERVIRDYNKTYIPERYPYLESRGISAEILRMEEFRESVRVNQFGSVVFTHKNRQGICGLEIRGKDFKGFGTGGQKGIWLSKLLPEASELVFFESGINALSYAALKPGVKRWYASTAGEWNPSTPDLIKATAEKFKGDRIILSYDPDKTGGKLTEQTLELLKDLEKEISIDVAPSGKDWNDLVCEKSRTPA